MFWENDREKESAGNDDCSVGMSKIMRMNFLITFSQIKGKGQSPFPH